MVSLVCTWLALKGIALIIGGRRKEMVKKSNSTYFCYWCGQRATDTYDSVPLCDICMVAAREAEWK